MSHFYYSGARDVVTRGREGPGGFIPKDLIFFGNRAKIFSVFLDDQTIFKALKTYRGPSGQVLVIIYIPISTMR